MKTSVIPAQITTVEDRIAGNLNFTQLLLLAAPLFLSAVIFFLSPPVGSYALYKLIVAAIITIISSTLAIRIKDKLLIDLIKLRANYYHRADVYVYRKQCIPEVANQPSSTKHSQALTSNTSMKVATISAKERQSSQKLMSNKKYDIAFQSRSGGLIVKVSIAQ